MATGCPAGQEIIPEHVPSAADSVSLSFSDLSPVGVWDILDPGLEGSVSKAQDGTLMLSFAGEPQAVSVTALADYDGAATVRRYCNFPINYTFDLGPKPAVDVGQGDEITVSSLEGVMELSYRHKETAIYLSGMPEHMLSLNDVTLTPESSIDVTLSIVAPWFVGGTVKPSFSVDMSRFFNAAEAVDGVLSFDALLSSANGWSQTRTFRLDGVAFDPANFDAEGHKLKLDAAIGLSGSVAFSGITTTAARYAAAPQRLGLYVTVVLHDVSVSSVTGTFDFSGSTASYDIPMSCLSTRGSQLLDLSGGKLTVAAIGELPAPCDVSTAVEAFNGYRSLAKASGLSFRLPQGEGAKQAWGDFGAAYSEDMAALLSTSFDKMSLKSVVGFRPDHVCTVPVGEPYSVSLVSMFECPVVPRDGYVVDLRDTVSVPQGLAAALSEGDVRLVGEIRNSLPVDVTVTLHGYGDSGSSLVGPFSFSVPASGSLGVNEVVKNRVGPSVNYLSYFLVCTHGVFGEGSRALRDDDGVVTKFDFMAHK